MSWRLEYGGDCLNGPALCLLAEWRAGIWAGIRLSGQASLGYMGRHDEGRQGAVGGRHM